MTIKTFTADELAVKTRQSSINKMSVPEILALHREIIDSDASFEVDSDESLELWKAHINAMETITSHLNGLN